MSDAPTPPDPPAPAAPLPPKWYDIFIDRYGFFAIAILAVSALCWSTAGKMRLDESIESMYSRNNPQLRDYQASKATFGGDEFVVVAWSQPNLDEPEGLDAIRAFSKELSSVPGVNSKSTQNIAEVLEPEEASFLVRMYLRLPATHENLMSSSEGVLLSSDRKTTAVVLRLEPPGNAEVPRLETYAKLRELGAAHDPPAVVVGEPIQVNDMFRYIEQDGRILGWASTIILLVVIYIMFRSVRWMIIPVLVVQVSLILMKALLVATGVSMSMVSSMVDSLIMIIGIATVMHFTVRFREFRATQETPQAFRSMLHDLFRPTVLMTLTTSIGFAVLYTSDINPIQTFGLMMAVGTLIALAAALCLTPAGALLGSYADDPKAPPFEKTMKRSLLAITHLVDKIPLLLGIGFIGLMTWSIWGIQYLTVETDFSKNFRSNTPLVIGLDFFENSLGGAGNWEVNFPAPKELDDAYLTKVRGLSADLKKLEVDGHPALTKVVAFTDPIDMIPSIAGNTTQKKRDLLRQFQPEFEPSMYQPGDETKPGRMRIILRSLERQPADSKLKIIQAVKTEGQKYFGQDVSTTGMFVLLAYLIENLLNDQLVSFILAAVSIVFLMAWAFHNWRVGLISLIPNIFPITVLVGAQGWSGVPVNIGTAMIASVSLGLTIDSSIHYLKRFFDELNKRGTVQAALEATHESVGLRMILANFALIAGFSVLTLSNFLPLVYFGILVSIAMLGGVLGNLILLPLLLKYVVRPVPMTPPANEPVPVPSPS